MIKSITALLWLSLAMGNVQAAGNAPVETPRHLGAPAVSQAGDTTLPAAIWLLLIIGMGSLGAAAQRRRIQA